MSESADVIEIEKMSIDQFAGSVVLILGAIGSLLLVVWQSRCGIHCRLGCSDNCYLCDCKRDPPPDKADELPVKEDEELLGPAAQANTERSKGIKVPVKDRYVPDDIRKGTFPEPEPELLVPPKVPMGGEEDGPMTMK